MQNIIFTRVRSFFFYCLLTILLCCIFILKKIPVGGRWALGAFLETSSWLAEKVVGKLLEETVSWVFRHTIERQLDGYWSVSKSISQAI